MRTMSGGALMFACTLVFAQSEPFEFKGIALGSEMATIEGNSRFSCRDPNSPIADRTCQLRYGERETIAGAPVRMLLLHFYDGKLHGITIAFDAKNFSQVSEALKQKYGEGDLKTEVVHNAMGANFENQTYMWRKSESFLRAKRFAGKIDTSSVTFQTDFGLEEFSRRRGRSVKERSKDL